ncbi:MAG: D-2-hydroxyacid dehydrogenase [Coprobacillus sp.]
MKILMVAPLKQEESQKIADHFINHEFIYSQAKNVTQQMIDDCDIIVGNIGFHVCLNRKNIKAILLNSAGSDAYVKDGILHSHTRLANGSGSYGKAIAEHTIGMILSLNKNLKTYIHNMDNHQWKFEKGGKELYRSTVVIVGLGDLGYELAKRLKAFDCYIIGIKRTMGSLPKDVDELYTTMHIKEILPKADYVILTLPQSKETIHMFDKEKLLLMKKDAVLVNVGRGSAIDTKALKDVLDQGHLSFVALDVVEEEPLKQDDTLWDYDNVLITPHASGGFEWKSVRDYYTDLVIRNIDHVINDETLENEVDFRTGYRKVISYK